MDILRLAVKAKKTISDNSPVILTALGVTGTVTTAYLTAKATFKATKKISDAEFVKKQESGYIKAIHKEPLTKKQKFKLVWPLYVPAVTTGLMTCTCIVGANYIGTKRAAALATAYSLSQEAVKEYKDKVIEKIGPEDEQTLRNEITQDRVTANPPGQPTQIVIGTGDVLCHDAWSSRYFMSSKNAIEKAQNEINYQINRFDHAALTDFYEKLGLEPTSESDDIGWNSDQPLELLWSTAEAPDGRPCLSYDFATVPLTGFTFLA